MSKLIRTVFPFVFALTQLICAANAASISQVASLPEAPTDWTDYVKVSRFDPSLGTLTGVTITLGGHINGLGKFESLAGRAGTVSALITGTLTLSGYGPVQGMAVSPSASLTQAVSAYDGVLDYGGTSGVTRGYQAGSVVSSSWSSAGDLNAFIGQGTFALPISATGLTTTSGPGNFRSTITTVASADVAVVYDYVVVPEPGTLLALGVGVIGFPLRRLRK